MKISKKDLKTIASMHISSRIADASLQRPKSHYRFFFDKVKLFYNFDPESIIFKKDDDDQIIGILIYTFNEVDFNQFSGPLHCRFYLRALKTILGFYGCRFGKFFAALRSMLGKNLESNLPFNDRYGKIWVLLVMEERRREGIAMELINSCADRMKKRGATFLRLTVEVDNKPAIKAYEKSNFKIIGKCQESSGLSYVMQYEISEDVIRNS